MAWKISRTFYDHDFPNPSLDDKITIFEDRVIGWLTEIADRVANEIPHSGFAVLLILASYFEMVAKFRDGFCASGQSKEHFKKGLRWVFPGQAFSNEQCELVYKELRSGLYHAGVTGPHVRLSRDFGVPLTCSARDKQMVVDVNPHTLPKEVEMHFVSYIQQLRDVTNADLRLRFERRFDWQGTPKRRSTKHP